MRAGRKAAAAAAVLATAALACNARATEDPPAQPAAGFAVPEERMVAAELIAEHASVQPGGSTRVGVHFDLDEGWHIYADPPGDAGLPTKIAWSVPRGVSVGPLEWPPHQEFVDPGDIKTFGYAGAVVLSSRLTLGPGAPADAVPVHASVKWLACKEICIPGSAELDLTLPVSAAVPALSTHTELFDHTG